MAENNFCNNWTEFALEWHISEIRFDCENPSDTRITNTRRALLLISRNFKKIKIWLYVKCVLGHKFLSKKFENWYSSIGTERYTTNLYYTHNFNKYNRRVYVSICLTARESLILRTYDIIAYRQVAVSYTQSTQTLPITSVGTHWCA